MPAVAFKTASRAVVRQTARIQRQNCQITKRHSSNKAADGSAREPHNKVHSDPVLASIPEAGTVPTVPTVPRFWHKLGPLSEPFKAFGRAQRTRPYATQFFTSLAISLFGDMGAQWIGGENYNPYRTLRALTTGAVASIPNYHWYMFLGNHFNYASKVASLAMKVVVNQLLFTPVFNTYFFGMQSLLAGDSLAVAWERVKRTVPISFVNSCKLWPAVTAINFTFVNAQYRSIFAGVVAVGWQTYLSFLNRQAESGVHSERGQLSKAMDMERAEELIVTTAQGTPQAA